MTHDHMSQNRFFEHDMAISTLAANTAFVSAILATTNEQGLRIQKLKAALTYRAKTNNEGPLSVGFSVGLSAAQIKESLEAIPTSSQDEEATDRANRKFFPMWLIPHDGTDETDVTEYKTIRDFPKWIIQEGTSLDVWVFNHLNSALTAGSSVTVHGWLRGTWQRD